jgi:nucleotide-binding universal stress UspA family protein
MYRSILVPLDGSPFSEHALPLALSIARRAGGQVQLAYVHSPVSAVYGESAFFLDTNLETEFKNRQRAYLDRMVKRLGQAAKVPVSAVLLEGQIAERLHAQAVNGGADLVVMTTHARGPMARFWLGSVADELVRQMAMPPMLFVHPKPKPPDFKEEPVLKHMLLPLDGSALAEQMLEPALALGSLMEADYTLLRVIKPVIPESYELEGAQLARPALVMVERIQKVHEQLRQEAEAYLEKTAERLRARSLRVQTRVAIEEQPAVAILQKVEALGSDVVALETHGLRGLKRLFLGSVADKVLRGSTVPVFVHRPVES